MPQELEGTIASYFGRQHCLLVGSGTTAIYVILKALHLPDDTRVLYPSITCETALNACIYAGLTPVFGDIDPHTFNLEANSVAEQVDRQGVGVVLATHLFGTIFDVAGLRRLLGDREVFILEDVAQAYGGRLGDSPIGKFGDASIISFGDGKLLDCGGGGAVLTDDSELFEQCQATFGELQADEGRRAVARDEYLKAMYTLTKECGDGVEFACRRDLLKRKHRDVYLSGQLADDAIQLISTQFARIDAAAAIRRERFETLRQMLADCSSVKLPCQIGVPVPWRFSFVVADDRDAVFDELIARSVRATRFFKPLHREFGLPERDYPHSVKFFEGVVNIDLDVDEELWCRSVAAIRDTFAQVLAE